jgi:hypothetical protein
MMAMENGLERVLGSKGRSGGQFDGWQAVYSPLGEDGYPKPIFDKATGAIDAEVAGHWREKYDLRQILERDWATLGPKLRGKLHVYCGDMDNYYLNNAVYLLEEFLEKADPPADAFVDYGDSRASWNGDQRIDLDLRLRYHTLCRGSSTGCRKPRRGRRSEKLEVLKGYCSLRRERRRCPTGGGLVALRPKVSKRAPVAR